VGRKWARLMYVRDEGTTLRTPHVLYTVARARGGVRTHSGITACSLLRPRWGTPRASHRHMPSPPRDITREQRHLICRPHPLGTYHSSSNHHITSRAGRVLCVVAGGGRGGRRRAAAGGGAGYPSLISLPHSPSPQPPPSRCRCHRAPGVLVLIWRKWGFTILPHSVALLGRRSLLLWR
jgi:hypothetical protein